MRSTVVRFKSSDSHASGIQRKDKVTRGRLLEPFARGLEKMKSLGKGLSQQGKNGLRCGTFFSRRLFCSLPVTPGRRFVGMIHPRLLKITSHSCYSILFLCANSLHTRAIVHKVVVLAIRMTSRMAEDDKKECEWSTTHNISGPSKDPCFGNTTRVPRPIITISIV